MLLNQCWKHNSRVEWNKKVKWYKICHRKKLPSYGVLFSLQQDSCGRDNYPLPSDLATIGDNTWNVPNMQHIIPNSKRWDYSDIPSGAINRLKDPPTRLKVATTLENPPNPHPQQQRKHPPIHSLKDLVTEEWGENMMYPFLGNFASIPPQFQDKACVARTEDSSSSHNFNSFLLCQRSSTHLRTDLQSWANTTQLGRHQYVRTFLQSWANTTQLRRHQYVRTDLQSWLMSQYHTAEETPVYENRSSVMSQYHTAGKTPICENRPSVMSQYHTADETPVYEKRPSVMSQYHTAGKTPICENRPTVMSQYHTADETPVYEKRPSVMSQYHTAGKTPVCENRPSVMSQYHTAEETPVCENIPSVMSQYHTAKETPVYENRPSVMSQYHTAGKTPVRRCSQWASRWCCISQKFTSTS